MKKWLFGTVGLILLSTPSYAHPADACLRIFGGNGFLSLGTILLFVCGFIALVAALALYLFLDLPIKLLKWALLVFGIAVVYQGHYEPFSVPAGLWAFLGASALGGFAYWFVREVLPQKHDLTLRLVALIISVVWGAIAISYDQSVVGTMAVAAFGYVIATTDALELLTEPFGIGEVKYSGGVTVAGFTILAMYLIGARFELPIAPFEFGAFYVSGLVLSASLLVNTWSGLSATWLGYLTREMIFVGFALVSVLYGAELGASSLVEMGGTFIAAWVLMKVAQFVVRVAGHSPLLAIVAVFVFGVVGVGLSTTLMQHADTIRAYTYF